MSKPKKSKNDQQATVYHLSSEHEGQTIAAVLKALQENATWGQVKKCVTGRHVQINGNLCVDEARRVTEKDVVKVFAEPLPKPVQARDIRIVYVDEHLLVVEKPAGVTSVRHAAERQFSTRRRQLQPTLEELIPPALAKKLHLRWPPLPPKGMNRGRHSNNLQRRGSRKVIQNAKKLPPELQIFPVHRLDRDTSGLMVFARTRQMEQKLIVMFRRHKVQRDYVAFCHGAIKPQTIQSWLVRDRGDGLRGSLGESATDDERAEALEAITHIHQSEVVSPTESHFNSNTGPDDSQSELDAAFLAKHDASDAKSPSPEKLPAISKLRLQLETGRTHQIRIHLSEAGHPICGDKIYGSPTGHPQNQSSLEPTRQALHSDSLSFTHPLTGEAHKFHMPLPQDLKHWLTKVTSSKSSS